MVALLLAACGGSSTPAGDEGVDAGPEPGDLAVTVASYDLAVGPPARLLVGIETDDRRLVTYGTVELRFLFAGTGEGGTLSPGPTSTGRYLPVAGSDVPDPEPTAPQAVTASEARGVYSTHVAFDRAGFWKVEVTADVDGTTRHGEGAFQVLDRHRLPAVGDEAPATENLTLTTPDTPRAAVDSRGASGEIPDPELHRTTIAAALGAGRPVVAVFSTPVYCTSRFCGPVTDTVDELARRYGDRAAFVHVEVWRDFQGKVVNKSAAEWLLRSEGLTEPWVYVVGGDRRIVARFDNVVNRSELEPVIQALPTSRPAGQGTG